MAAEAVLWRPGSSSGGGGRYGSVRSQSTCQGGGGSRLLRVTAAAVGRARQHCWRLHYWQAVQQGAARSGAGLLHAPEDGKLTEGAGGAGAASATSATDQREAAAGQADGEAVAHAPTAATHEAGCCGCPLPRRKR